MRTCGGECTEVPLFRGPSRLVWLICFNTGVSLHLLFGRSQERGLRVGSVGREGYPV